MENEVNTPATPESVWEALRELSLSIKASGAESDRQRAEFDRQRKESDRQRKESEARFNRELAESSARFNRELAESSARFNREMAASRAEYDKRRTETDRQIRELKEAVNGISSSNGLFAEEYFFNSFENGERTFLGETFDDIEKNVKGLESKDEYDIVLINGKSVGIIEVKYKGRLDDIPKIINKANTFRANYPKFQNHKVYLAMASMTFHQRLEDECSKQGIAIVKQVGDTVVINDEHLRAY